MDSSKQKARGIPVPAIIVAVLAITFGYTRYVMWQFGAASPWCSYFYQYGLGLVTFAIGIYLVLKTGSCQPGRGRDSHWLKWMIGGFVFFATLHAVWILLALHMPHIGGN